MGGIALTVSFFDYGTHCCAVSQYSLILWAGGVPTCPRRCAVPAICMVFSFQENDQRPSIQGSCLFVRLLSIPIQISITAAYLQHSFVSEQLNFKTTFFVRSINIKIAVQLVRQCQILMVGVYCVTPNSCSFIFLQEMGGPYLTMLFSKRYLQ